MTMQHVLRIEASKDDGNKRGANDNRTRTVREVVDPVTGEKVNVLTIATNGGVDDMHAKGRVTDWQKAAADRFLALYEAAHSDGLRAIDYSRVRVDGGAGAPALGGDRAVRALSELERLRLRIGDADYAALLTVVVRGWSIRRIGRVSVERTGGVEATVRKLATRALLRALDALDAHWNTSVGTGKGIRAEATYARDDGSAPIVEARTKGGARFVAGVSRSKDIAALKKAGLA